MTVYYAEESASVYLSAKSSSLGRNEASALRNVQRSLGQV